MNIPELIKEEQYLVDKYGDNLVGLIAYGSMVFGKPRKGSIRDYWAIYRDYEDFHSRNADFYRTGLNRPSTVAAQIAVNKGGPNFYQMWDEEHGLHIKIAAIQEEDFYTFCTNNVMVVKGRMQKPVKAIRTTPRIETAIAFARAEGAQDGVDLVDEKFTLNDFLFAVMSLSYRAEVRLEGKNKKIQSIIDKGRREIEAVYLPLLHGFDFIRVERDGTYTDTRPRDVQRRANRAVWRKLRRLKYGGYAWKVLWRNYHTFKNPVPYCWRKLTGEINKVLARLFFYPFFRKSTANRMIALYKDDIAARFDVSVDQLDVGAVTAQTAGCFKAEVTITSPEGPIIKQVRCQPLKTEADPARVIARDMGFRFTLVEA